jgi:ATP-dependent DNA helicase DinG
VSIELPWQDLGLSRFCVAVESCAVVFEGGSAAPDPACREQRELPRVVYPGCDNDGANEGEIDLRLLARVLYPTLSDHRLESVCAHCGTATESDPAATAGAVFASMLEEAIELDRELVALLARLLPAPLSGLFDRILLVPRPERPPIEKSQAATGPAEVDRVGAAAAEVLGSEGVIADALPVYEERSGQLKMAEAVQEAFRDGEALLVEAGPGTGKTFAYLVPAILHLRADPSTRVAVSTRTKQLQEQLYGKDLPFLLQRLAPHLKVALLKGRENYLCLRRWQALVSEMVGGFERDRLTVLAPLARWLLESGTGDIDENGAFLSDPESRGVWGRLCDAPNHCVGVFCPFLDDCFSIAARRRARKADLVVVNHSLLLGDLAVGGVVLGKYTHLIVDEAHSLEAAARTAFTRSLSERIIARVADDLAPAARRPGWLRRLSLPFVDADVKQATEDVATVRRTSATLFRSLDRKLPEERRGTFSSLSGVEPRIVETTTALKRLEMALDRLGGRLEAEETRKELEGHIDRVVGLADVAGAITVPPDENTVHWYEREYDGLALHATPLDVAPFFQRLLYPRIESVVLTSATLSLAGDFEYLSRSVGLTDGVLRVRTAVVESPFSFPDRMKVAVPAYFPPIDSEEDAYVQGLASLLGTLAARLGKKGLALFTSYQMLGAVRDRIPPGITTYAQGFDGPRSKLIDRFRAHPDAGILLGTESFWEGVDLPGEEMEFLVITRLPFSVPTDPILSALADRIAREGRDPFRDLSLPQAVLKLRQGVGRLIRTKEDHGIVILTDQRVLSRSYGKRFIESFPVPVDTFDDESDLVEEVVGWFVAGE